MTVSVWNPSLAYAPQPSSVRLSADEGPRLRGPRKLRSFCARSHVDSAARSHIESSTGALEVILSTDDAKKKRRRGRSLAK